MCDERASGSAARDRLHCRRLDFGKALTGQVLANRSQDDRAVLKTLDDFGTLNHVDVSMTKQYLDVLSAVMFVRRMSHRLGEENDLVGKDCHFAGARSSDGPFNPHQIPKIGQFEDSPGIP